MRFLVRIFCMALAICLCFSALAEDIYFMGPKDALYHLDDGCGGVIGDMYLVSLEAANEFQKMPCPKCAGEVEIRARKLGSGAVTVVEAKGRKGAEFSMENARFSREIDGAHYFVVMSHEMEGAQVMFSVDGAEVQKFPVTEITEIDREPVVSIYRDSRDEFSAWDVFGLRLCEYSNQENGGILEAEVCLFPGDEEFFGEVPYGLKLPSKGYSDRGIVHYWLLTREEFARMDSVTIAGYGKGFAGEVYFEPFFTGENAPEEVDGIAGWQIGMSGAAAKKGYKDIDKVEKEDDFCGLYLGSSGHYVVAVKNPTKKRARQYAKIAGGDIWVVQGEYTMKEMNKARKSAEKIVEADFMSSSINPVTNRVEIEVCGAGIADYADRELFEPCVEVTFNGESVFERGAMAARDEEISRAPMSQTEVMDIKAHMEREEYPVGAEYISFCLETGAEVCTVALDGSLEKYAGDEWKKVAGEYWPMSQYGLKDAFEMSRIIVTPGVWSFKIPTEKYERLGEGLYRLSAFDYAGNDVAVEFAITKDAAPMEEYEEKRPGFAMPSPAEHMTASSAPGYNSLTDDFSHFTAGGWEFSLVWIPEEMWETNVNRVTAVIAWPEGKPEEAVKIYEAEKDSFRMFDAGDGIVIMGISEIIRMDYDGGNVETIITAKKGFKQALMLDKDIYYLAGNHLWRWSGGETEKIWSPKKGTGEVLEYYDDTLYATNAAGKTVEIDISK